jgi:hypothetical protein
MTSHIDPQLTLKNNIPGDNDKVKLALPCANYVGDPNGGIRVMHITQKLGYIKELGIFTSGDEREWEHDSRLAAMAYEFTQFSCNLALMSGQDSAQPVAIDED